MLSFAERLAAAKKSLRIFVSSPVIVTVSADEMLGIEFATVSKFFDCSCKIIFSFEVAIFANTHPIITRQEITSTKNIIPTFLIIFAIIKPPILLT